MSQRTCATCGAPVLGDGPCSRCVMGAVMDPGQAPVLKHGATIGAYEILDTLGTGGMGIVYRARHIHLGRTVALKVLSRAFASDTEFVERFRREAKALAELTHPNIVGVYDFGLEGDLPYIAMEHVDGVSLRRLISERRLPPEEALLIVPQLCDALDYAHGRGIVHRDIKPENIMIGRGGVVKIADFGIAKMVRRGDGALPTLTNTDVSMGTPNYMAPEQRENFRSVDHRADIFSMGVVFYEMLTGELPLGRFHPPSRKAGVNGRLDDIVLKALEKEPAERYQRAREVKEDLTHVYDAVPPRPPPMPLAHRRSNPVVWIVGCLVLLMVGLVALAGVGFLLLTARVESPRAVPAPRPVDPAPVRPPAAEDARDRARRAFVKLETDLTVDMAKGEFKGHDLLRDQKAAILILDPDLREKFDTLERRYLEAYEAAGVRWVKDNGDNLRVLEKEKKFEEALRLIETFPQDLRRSDTWAQLKARSERIKAQKAEKER